MAVASNYLYQDVPSPLMKTTYRGYKDWRGNRAVLCLRVFRNFMTRCTNTIDRKIPLTRNTFDSKYL